ncbi:MAG: site-specific integrase, partial [Bifidobacteriaceae bacterium]|nr:site-specific integrase [Bifidobacteriaceae bacterium]
MKLSTAARRFLAHLRVERGLAAATLEAYAGDLAKYMEFAGDPQLEDVTQKEVEGFRGALAAQGLAAASARRAMAAVRGLHRFALLEGWTAVDPAAEVAPPRVGLRLPKAITVDQV